MVVQTGVSVAIESLVLGNHIESVNGLLNVLGGGWIRNERRIAPDGKTLPTHMGIGVVVSIPWNETNRDHEAIIVIRDEDAQAIFNANLTITAGREPGMRPGTTQYPSPGFSIDIVFPHAGGYEVVASLAGVKGSERRYAFQIVDVKLQAIQSPSA